MLKMDGVFFQMVLVMIFFSAICDIEAPTVLVLGKNQESGHFELLVEDAARTIYEMKDNAYPWTKEAIAAEEQREKERIEKEKEQVKDFQIFKDENVKILKNGNGDKVDVVA